MTGEPNHDQLADDVRQARVIDITRFLNHDDDVPTSIAAAAKQPDNLYGLMARSLCCKVGSAQAVELLNSAPYELEPFDWSDIATEDRQIVSTLLDLIESPNPADYGSGESLWEILGHAPDGMPWVDDEYRTIIRRIVRVLALDPTRPLKRRCKDERLAAAIVWVSLDASGGIASHGRRRWKSKHLWEWFDVTSCMDIGRSLGQSLRRIHLGQEPMDDELAYRARSEPTRIGNASLLHSSYRKQLIEEREYLRTSIAAQSKTTRENHPIACHDGRRVELRSRPVRVRWATRGMSTEGRASISLALGDDLADLEILALTVTDAHRLIQAVQFALDEPAAI